VSRSVIVADGEIVNPYVAEALSELTVDQLSWVSRELEPLRFAAGNSIINQGEAADRFYIITRGEVEILLPQPGGVELAVDRLRQGQYFGEMGLLRDSRRNATVRASTDDVEVVALDREDFTRLLGESASTRAEFDRVVGERAARNSRNPAAGVA
jgi:sulfate-transporting ATPase